MIPQEIPRIYELVKKAKEGQASDQEKEEVDRLSGQLNARGIPDYQIEQWINAFALTERANKILRGSAP